MHFQHSAGLWRDFPALVPGVLYADGITSQARDASGAEASEGSVPSWHSAPCSHVAATLVNLRSLESAFVATAAGPLAIPSSRGGRVPAREAPPGVGATRAGSTAWRQSSTRSPRG